MSKKAPKTGTVQVEFKLPGRTNYNLSHTVRTSMLPGTINPLTHIRCTPRDRIEINPTALIRTHPALAPIFGTYLCRLYAFWVPFRLYVPELRINDVSSITSDGWDTFADARFPCIRFYPFDTELASGDNIQLVPRSGLMEAIGFAAGSGNPYNSSSTAEDDIRPFNAKKFNGFRILAYYDIFRNYFANPNERYYPCFVNQGENQLGSGTTLVGLSFDALNDYFVNQAYNQNENERWVFVDANGYTTGSGNNSFPWYTGQANTSSWALGLIAKEAKYAGLCTKTYLPDLNSTFIGTGQYLETIARSIVKVNDGNLNMQDLLVGQRLFNYFQKMAAVGARFDEWIRAEYGLDIRKYLDIPVFLKSWSFNLNFDDVVSTNAFSPDDQTGLGQLAGRGLGGFDGRDRKHTLAFRPEEYGEIVIYMTIEPRPDYAKGIDPFLLDTQFDDLFTPSLDRLGMEPVHVALLDSTPNPDSGLYEDDIFNEVVGYQPAWTRYKSMVNRVTGDLAGNLSYWTLIRDTSKKVYEFQDIPVSSYIDPSQFVESFSVTDGTESPFLVQVGFDVIAKRPQSARSMTGFAEGLL